MQLRSWNMSGHMRIALPLIGLLAILTPVTRRDHRFNADAQVTPRPGPRVDHSLVYDEARRRVILLGGYRSHVPALEEAWSWDGQRWELITASGPRARRLSATAYDANRKRIVLHGGAQLEVFESLGDTWEWTANGWVQLADDGAVARDHHAIAFDANRNQLLLFGGRSRASSWPRDTLRWDGSAWARVSSEGPVGRARTSLVYDSKRQRVVMFGGYGGPPDAREPRRYLADTWTWEGLNWREHAATGPPRRYAHAMAFDSRAGVTVLYGGEDANVRFEDMWQWDGERWSEIKITGDKPGPRYAAAMAYDSARARVVLYGGIDSAMKTALDDTWEWDGQRWVEVKQR
jgi:hypothetical protein